MTTEHSTNVMHTAPSDTASPGFHQPDTLDWSSFFAQIKNRVIVIPSAQPRWPESAPIEKDGTDASEKGRE